MVQRFTRAVSAGDTLVKKLVEVQGGEEAFPVELYGEEVIWKRATELDVKLKNPHGSEYHGMIAHPATNRLDA